MPLGIERTSAAGQTPSFLNHPTLQPERCQNISSFLVRECVPATVVVVREAPLRTAHIARAEQALGLSWIDKLPGQKRIRYIHGQIFVTQDYLGWRVIRAHICRDDEKSAAHFA
jgi:hypothetical protein